MIDLKDPQRFQFDRSAYERPNAAYRCGRAALWGKPCANGPNADGSCGDDGACRPRRTLRNLRARIAWTAAGLAAALVLGFTGLDWSGHAPINISNPGPLWAGHAGFVEPGDCAACHAAHDDAGKGWFRAVFQPADMTASCIDCHSFGGRERAPHNDVFAGRNDLGETTCVMCHIEHKGARADIVAIDDTGCANCHKRAFGEFARGHPNFSPKFPAFRRTSINFNHASHIGKHFPDPRYAEQAPANCTACHADAPGAPTMPVRSFETACAACHEEQIAKRELVVLRLPEIRKSLLDRQAMLAICGPPARAYRSIAAGAQLPGDDGEPFESVSVEEMSLASSYLLDIAPDDPDEYGRPIQKLILAMAKDGTAPLSQALDRSAGRAVSAELLAGLSPELARRVACEWASNREYEPPGEAMLTGWRGDYVELRYRPMGHADTVARAWIEFSLAAARDARNDATWERATALRDSVIDTKEGVGACTKCHAVSLAGADAAVDDIAVEWPLRRASSRPRHVFSHDIHIKLFDAAQARLTDAGKGCRGCHEIDETTDYAAGFADFDPGTFASSFRPIKKKSCATCHSSREVREDCRLCHTYHRDPSLKVRISTNGG
jgi:hypothetical protein